jgi:formylglycine-generating enzyme required for sulfatase activity
VRRLAVFSFSAFLASCAEETKAPPPEALIVVDTNLAVPLNVGRLRVDLYSEDGTWFASSDFSRPDPRDWPVSFSVFSAEAEAARERIVYVRLRGYPDGYAEPYVGERFRDWEAPLASPAATNEPRLVVDGIDRTPFDEPAPLLTIDRLVSVRLKPNERGRARVLLHGACVGTMTKLGKGGKPAPGAESCVDREKERAAIIEVPLEPTIERPAQSSVGTWMHEPCAPGDSTDEVACVPGGPTLFGTVENNQLSNANPNSFPAAPIRTFAVRRFFIDKDEITVARVRSALARGYTGARPGYNDGPLGSDRTGNVNADCTFSKEPMGREHYAANCMAFSTAQSLCEFFGGELPTEVQFEHAATVAGHPTKRRFPWGNDLGDCSKSVFARDEETNREWGICAALGTGPRPPEESEADVSPLGIRRLMGNVAEWVRDEPHRLDSECWLQAPFLSPVCKGPVDRDRRSLRGTGHNEAAIRPTFRRAAATALAHGARCVYRSKP